MAIASKIKAIDFYRKVPRDLTEATVFGSMMSMLAAFLMVSLFFFELHDFLNVRTESSIIVDRSVDGDLLRINFNFSFPSLSCEHTSVDVSDTMGNHRVNLTKTVHKYPIDRHGNIVGEVMRDFPDPVYERLEVEGKEAATKDNGANDSILTTKTFAAAIETHPILMVNFYTSWCPWSKMLEPVWAAAEKAMLVKFPADDGRIKLARINCEVDMALCKKNHIQAFPSIRIFRAGNDLLVHGEHHDHEAYVGDRTTEAIVSFAEKLVPAPAGSAALPAADLTEHALQTVKVGSPGCSVQGFVLVKKVPGNMHISAHSHKHSFDFSVMNMTHQVHHLSFGTELSRKKWAMVEALHPEGLLNAWSNRLRGRVFVSHEANITQEHYCQVVMTSVEPRGDSTYHHNRVDLYEYTHHSHAIHTEDMPMAKFSFDPSPMQVLVKEQPRPFYHFLTTVCAIVGGVFTVAGMADSSVFSISKALKKVELGKHY